MGMVGEHFQKTFDDSICRGGSRAMIVVQNNDQLLRVFVENGGDGSDRCVIGYVNQTLVGEFFQWSHLNARETQRQNQMRQELVRFPVRLVRCEPCDTVAGSDQRIGPLREQRGLSVSGWSNH